MIEQGKSFDQTRKNLVELSGNKHPCYAYKIIFNKILIHLKRVQTFKKKILHSRRTIFSFGACCAC